MYEKIVNDTEIIEIYKSISEFEDKNKAWAHHDFNHVLNVAMLCEKLLKDLDYDDDVIQDVKIAAILHDVGSTEGKEGHSNRSYEFAEKYFKKNKIKLKNESLVLDAIKIHSDGFISKNIYALVLILSDKLDIKYTRIAKEGYNIIGMRQLQYIKNILIDINKEVFKVNFICDDKIDINELENFYFIHKVFKAIKSFSKKLQLISEVMVNGDSWDKFYNID